MDAVIHATEYKHIHFMHMQSFTKQGNPEPQPTTTSGRIGDDRDYFMRIIQSENSSKCRGPSHTKSEIMKKMNE